MPPMLAKGGLKILLYCPEMKNEEKNFLCSEQLSMNENVAHSKELKDKFASIHAMKSV